MAKSITVRHVPEPVHRELASRAAREGKSLQEFLLAQLVRLTERPTTSELLERIRARKTATRTELPAERILEHRDADRR